MNERASRFAPITGYLLVAGALNLVWPSALEFILGILGIIFVYVSWKFGLLAAFQVMGHILFPCRPDDQPPAEPEAPVPKPKQEPKPKPPPTQEELDKWAKIDSKKRLGKSYTMDELGDLPDDYFEEPF